jgi:hypothetical protein
LGDWLDQVVSGHLCLYDFNYFIDNVVQLVFLDGAHSIQDDVGIGSEQPIGPDVACLFQPAGLEVGIVDWDGVSVCNVSARDLTQDGVISFKRRQNKRGSPF